MTGQAIASQGTRSTVYGRSRSWGNQLSSPTLRGSGGTQRTESNGIFSRANSSMFRVGRTISSRRRWGRSFRTRIVLRERKKRREKGTSADSIENVGLLEDTGNIVSFRITSRERADAGRVNGSIGTEKAPKDGDFLQIRTLSGPRARLAREIYSWVRD